MRDEHGQVYRAIGLDRAGELLRLLRKFSSLGYEAALAEADERQQGVDIVFSRPDETPMKRRYRQWPFLDWITTMWCGSMIFETPMLFAIGFIFMFTIGDFVRLILATMPFDIQRQDTCYMVAHFHYVLVCRIKLCRWQKAAIRSNWRCSILSATV